MILRDRQVLPGRHQSEDEARTVARAARRTVSIRPEAAIRSWHPSALSWVSLWSA